MEIKKPDLLGTLSAEAQVAHYIGWTKANNSIIRSINLHILEALCQCFDGKDLAADLMKALDEEFASVRIAVAYVLFKELLDLCIPDSSYPLPAFSKVEMLLTQLKAAGYEFNEKCQAMILLAKLPPSMDIIAQMFTQAKDSILSHKDPA